MQDGKSRFCTACSWCGTEPKLKSGGSLEVEVVMWVGSILAAYYICWALVFVALIYSAWRHFVVYIVCPTCERAGLITLDPAPPQRDTRKDDFTYYGDSVNDRIGVDNSDESDLIFIDPPDNLDREFGARSSSGEKNAYTINPFEMTCTCADFIDRREDYVHGDIRRACKHLAQFYRNSEWIEDEFIREIFSKSSGRGGVPHIILEKYMFGKTRLILGKSPSWNSVKVFSRKKRTIDDKDNYTGRVLSNEFIFSENNWKYSPSPDGAKEIRRIIKESFDY